MMARRLWVASCAALLVAFVLDGCGRAKEAVETAQDVGKAAEFAADMRDGEGDIETEEGTVSVEANDEEGNVTVHMQGEDGEEMSYAGGEDLDTAGLDIPLYPGAKKLGGSTITADGKTRMTFTFESADSYEKVRDFYRDKYPDANQTETTMDNQQMCVLTATGDPANLHSIHVSTRADKDVVTIMLMQESSEGGE